MDFLIILVLIVISYIMIIRSKISSLNKSINRCKSVMNSYLKKRYDLLPKIIENTKTIVQYNEETIKKMNSLSSCFESSNDMAKDVMDTEYNNFIKKIESFPAVINSTNYKTVYYYRMLIESAIESCRKVCTVEIKEYNKLIEKLPNSIVAKIFKFEVIKYDENILNDVKVNEDSDNNPVGESVNYSPSPENVITEKDKQ